MTTTAAAPAGTWTLPYTREWGALVHAAHKVGVSLQVVTPKNNKLKVGHPYPTATLGERLADWVEQQTGKKDAYKPDQVHIVAYGQTGKSSMFRKVSFKPGERQLVDRMAPAPPPAALTGGAKSPRHWFSPVDPDDEDDPDDMDALGAIRDAIGRVGAAPKKAAKPKKAPKPKKPVVLPPLMGFIARNSVPLHPWVSIISSKHYHTLLSKSEPYPTVSQLLNIISNLGKTREWDDDSAQEDPSLFGGMFSDEQVDAIREAINPDSLPNQEAAKERLKECVALLRKIANSKWTKQLPVSVLTDAFDETVAIAQVLIDSVSGYAAVHRGLSQRYKILTDSSTGTTLEKIKAAHYFSVVHALLHGALNRNKFGRIELRKYTIPPKNSSFREVILDLHPGITFSPHLIARADRDNAVIQRPIKKFNQWALDQTPGNYPFIAHKVKNPYKNVKVVAALGGLKEEQKKLFYYVEWLFGEKGRREEYKAIREKRSRMRFIRVLVTEALEKFKYERALFGVPRSADIPLEELQKALPKDRHHMIGVKVARDSGTQYGIVGMITMGRPVNATRSIRDLLIHDDTAVALHKRLPHILVLAAILLTQTTPTLTIAMRSTLDPEGNVHVPSIFDAKVRRRIRVTKEAAPIYVLSRETQYDKFIDEERVAFLTGIGPDAMDVGCWTIMNKNLPKCY